MRFPVFVSLSGRAAVVVGGGEVGCRRARVLRDFGACVTVVSPELREKMEGVLHIARSYQEGDLKGAFLAVAATNNAQINAAVGQEARAQRTLFNRADCQEDCDFFFPAVCLGEGIVAGIAGDGSNHTAVKKTAEQVRDTLRRAQKPEEPYAAKKNPENF